VHVVKLTFHSSDTQEVRVCGSSRTVKAVEVHQALGAVRHSSSIDFLHVPDAKHLRAVEKSAFTDTVETG